MKLKELTKLVERDGWYWKRTSGSIFRRSDKYDGVRPINIYLLRLLYGSMFFVLGKTVWTHIFTHKGPWEPTDAVTWCVWAAFATLAGLGIVRPLKMLPMILVEIFYKVLWLGMVAYPLWTRGALAGSAAEGTAAAFLWVILPIVAMPWGYAFVSYVYDPKSGAAKSGRGERRAVVTPTLGV